MTETCKHRIIKQGRVWLCVKCNKFFTVQEIEHLATVGANAPRMCKECESADQEVKGR